jgi:hypothetical protein
VVTGLVRVSSRLSHAIASLRVDPHISSEGLRPAQNDGRSGLAKIPHALAAVRWMHRSPALLPAGIPGIGLVIEGAMQQAPQCGRQFMLLFP